MTLSEIDIKGALERAKELASTDKTLPTSVRSVIELLVLRVGLLLRRLNVNSRNSSVPPPARSVSQAGKKRSAGGELPQHSQAAYRNRTEKFSSEGEKKAPWLKQQAPGYPQRALRYGTIFGVPSLRAHCG